MIRSKSIIRFSLLCLSFFLCYNTQGQEKKSLKVLFVGNSYIYYENLPQVVSFVSASTSTEIVTKKSTIGGARLSEHWNEQRGLKTKELIQQGKFDIVVLQEWSLGAIEQPDSLAKYVKLFSDLIRSTGARPYLYMTWAREKVPQMQEQISKVYKEVALANNAGIVPVGEAWAQARKIRAGVPLFIADGSHPSDLGTFLTACVFVTTLTGEIPDEIKGEIYIQDIHKEWIELMRIDAHNREFCLEVCRSLN